MYPQCINLEVSGSGSEAPAGVVATSLYTSADPGIFFNPYQPNLEYPIPGPALSFGAGGGNDGGDVEPAPEPPADPTAAPEPPADPTAAPPAPAPTTLSSAVSQPPATPTDPADGGNSEAQALYYQCGGLQYTGPTVCAEGTCKEWNPYYSQCVPN